MTDILNRYDPIALGEMKGVRLMNRTDTKFVTTTGKLSELLKMARSEYFVQQIDGKRVASYYTMYFDTEQCDMFLTHQSGRLNRQKLRIRSYVDSGLNFLEVKTKNNHKKTKKERVSLECFDPERPCCDMVLSHADDSTDGGCREFLLRTLRYDPSTLKEQLENRFDRVTLVNKQKTERLTIDTSLRFHNLTTGRDASFDGLAIIELKRDGLAHSPILEMLRQLRIKPMGFSKYCMGTVMTNNELKHNCFLPRMRMVEKLREGR